MGMPKNELITKLEEISALYANTVAIQSQMDDFTPEDHYDRQVVVPQFPGEYKSEKERNAWQELIGHDEEDAVQIMDMAYERVHCPKEPAKPNIGKRPENTHDTANALKKKLGCLPIVAAFVAVCSLISGGLFSGEAGTIIGNLVIIGACAVAVLFFLKKYKSAQQADEEVTKVMIKNYDESKREAEEKYEQDMNIYQTERTAYILSKGDFLEEYTAWREIYLDHLREEAEIEEKLEADRIAGVNRIYEEQYMPAQKKLEESNDLITAEYLPVLHIIIELIKSGRADDLKEAVNLYEELVYRERQLQLQREQEEQRRYEEEQRRRDEERRYQEEKQFREDQERQRRYDAEQQRREEERRAKDREKQEWEAASRAEREAKSRCHWCKKYHSCGIRHNPPLNCTAFDPSNTHTI